LRVRSCNPPCAPLFNNLLQFRSSLRHFLKLFPPPDLIGKSIFSRSAASFVLPFDLRKFYTVPQPPERFIPFFFLAVPYTRPLLKTFATRVVLRFSVLTRKTFFRTCGRGSVDFLFVCFSPPLSIMLGFFSFKEGSSIPIPISAVERAGFSLWILFSFTLRRLIQVIPGSFRPLSFVSPCLLRTSPPRSLPPKHPFRSDGGVIHPRGFRGLPECVSQFPRDRQPEKESPHSSAPTSPF